MFPYTSASSGAKLPRTITWAVAGQNAAATSCCLGCKCGCAQILKGIPCCSYWFPGPPQAPPHPIVQQLKGL